MIDFAMMPLRSVGAFGLHATPDATAAAAKALGLTPRRVGKLDYLADSAIQIEYGASGRVQFIGVSAAPTLYRLTFAGVDLFDQPADVVEDLFATHEAAPSGRAAEDHLGTLIFPRQIVALWSSDAQYDRVRLASGRRPLRPVWAQIGIGTPDYLAAIRAVG